MATTAYLARKLLGPSLCGISMPVIYDINIALLDANKNELIGRGYERKEASFYINGENSASNSNDIEFGPSTDSWNSIYYIAIFDAKEDGNMLYYERVDTPIVISGGNSLVINENSIVVSLT